MMIGSVEFEKSADEKLIYTQRKVISTDRDGNECLVLFVDRYDHRRWYVRKDYWDSLTSMWPMDYMNSGFQFVAD